MITVNRLLLITATALSGAAASAQDTKQDVWEPLRSLVGKWEGTGEGKSGKSRVDTQFTFVLQGKFLEVRNKAVFDPPEGKSKGEVHEDWGIISYDGGRKKFVFRQFHVEGFVNQYVLDSLSADGKTIVFVSEAIENIPPGWRARVTYEIPSDGELRVIFDLAPPGKDFDKCAENRLKRKKES